MFDLHPQIVGLGNQISKCVSELMQLGKRLCIRERGGDDLDFFGRTSAIKDMVWFII